MRLAAVIPIDRDQNHAPIPNHVDARDAERALVSCLIGDPTQVEAIGDTVSIADFADPVAARLFGVVDALRADGADITIEAIWDALGEQDIPRPSSNELDDVFWAEIPSFWKLAPRWAATVRQQSLRRILVASAESISSAPDCGQSVARHHELITELDAVSEGLASPRHARFQFEPFGDTKLDTQATYLARGVLDQGAMAVMYGPSNSSKTFIALDLALCIAAGRPWHGRKVRQGMVVYVVAEGARGFKRRLRAAEHELYRNCASVLFWDLSTAINFMDPDGDVRPLIAAIRNLEARVGHTCVLVVIDTLARAMPGGNENAPEDMGALVASGDLVRRELDTAMLLIHHTGKDVAKGARGHSSLRAATDTELEVSRVDELCTVQASKQRDMDPSLVQHYRLREVLLGTDDEGDPITSCVVEESEPPAEDDTPEVAAARRAPRPSTTGQIIVNAMDAIHRDAVRLPGEIFDAVPDIGDPTQEGLQIDQLRREFLAIRDEGTEKSRNSAYKAFNRGLDELVGKGLVGRRSNWVWFTTEGAKCPRRGAG